MTGGRGRVSLAFGGKEGRKERGVVAKRWRNRSGPKVPRTIEVGVAIIVVDGGIFVFLIVACSLGGKKFNESVRQNDFLDSVTFIVYSQCDM